MADTTYGLGVDMSEVAKTLATFPQLTGEAAEKAVKELTQAFAKAEKASKALLKAQKAESEAAKKAAEDAAAALAAPSKAAKEFGDRAGDAESVLKALAGTLGMVAPSAGAALSSLGELAGGAEGAAKASALLGSKLGAILAVGGAALVVAGVGYAAYAAADAVVELVDGAGDLARELQEIEKVGGAVDSIGVSAATIASFDSASASLDAIGLLGDQLSLTFAAEFAPAVEQSARAIVKLGLIGRDVFNSYAEGEGVLRSLARFSIEVLVASLMGPVEALGHFARGLGEVAKLAGMDTLGDAAIGLADSWANLKTTVADGVIDAALSATGFSVQKLGEWTSDYDAEVDALIGTSQRYAAAQRDGTSATKGSAEATAEAAKAERDRAAAQAQAASEARALEKAVADAAKATSDILGESRAFGAEAPSQIERTRQEYEALNAALLAQIETNAKLGQSTAELEAERVALAQRTKTTISTLESQARDEKLAADQAAAQEAADLYREQTDAVRSAISSTIGDLGSAFSAYSDMLSTKYQATVDAITTAKEEGTDAEVALLEEKNKRTKKALMALFVAEQGAALAQVAIDTALAISGIQAAWAAVPFVSIPLTALAVGAGVAQAAAISAARPSFHSGGVVPSSQAGQGEVMSRLLPGEVVLNRQTVDRMGGPSQADRLNRGGSSMGSSPIILEQRYGHRVFDEVVYDDLRRPDSSLRKAISGRSRVGHRSR